MTKKRDEENPTQARFVLAVSVAGESQEFSLGALHLEYVLSILPDTADYAGFFGAAAQHQAGAVRRSAASREHLPGDAALQLATDPCSSVRIQAVTNRMFQRLASESTVLALIASDPDVAEAVANTMSMFENADLAVLCESLSRHPDPSVRRAVASNGATPTKWLRQLREDGSKDVAEMAMNELTSRSR